MSLADIGIANPDQELLEGVAKRAAAPGETIHNEPMAVTPALVLEAMRTADSAGSSFRQSKRS